MPESLSCRSDGRPGDSPDERSPSTLARLTARIRNTAFADRIARIGPEYVKKSARRITEADLDAVVERAEAIENRFRSNASLRRLLDDGRLLVHLVRDARRGRYRALPVWTLSAVGFVLLYVLNPFDLVPDTIPLLGLLDDAAVVSAGLSLVEQDLRDYRAWRRARSDASAEADAEALISS